MEMLQNDPQSRPLYRQAHKITDGVGETKGVDIFVNYELTSNILQK